MSTTTPQSRQTRWWWLSPAPASNSAALPAGSIRRASPAADERAQRVVHGLGGNRAQARRDDRGQLVGPVVVPPRAQRVEHGDALRGAAQPGRPDVGVARAHGPRTILECPKEQIHPSLRNASVARNSIETRIRTRAKTAAGAFRRSTAGCRPGADEQAVQDEQPGRRVTP